MANTCYNLLTILGEIGNPEQLIGQLANALYGADAEHLVYSCSVQCGMGVQFETSWDEPCREMTQISRQNPDLVFCLAYSCWESGFRGRTVYRRGQTMEFIRRQGYDGPGYLFANITHPVLDVAQNYVSQPTLAQSAMARLQDAINIVGDLKQVLTDERFTKSRYRAFSDARRVEDTTRAVIAMLDMMIEHAEQISFDSVLVTEPESKGQGTSR